MADEEHVEIIKDKGKFNRQKAKASVYKANTKGGYRFVGPKGDQAGQSANHHVLPCEAMQDGSITDDDEWLKYFHNCMAITKWDINESPNMYGLPTKNPFLSADKLPLFSTDMSPAALKSLGKKGEREAQKGGFGHLPNLPCHMNDHPNYNEGVITWMKQNIWPELKQQKEPCDLDPKNIRKLLNATSKHWKQWLIDRGEDIKGAAYCWINRRADPSITNTWFIPLSMAIVPTYRKAPAKYPKRDGTADQWLKSIFALLK